MLFQMTIREIVFLMVVIGLIMVHMQINVSLILMVIIGVIVVGMGNVLEILVMKILIQMIAKVINYGELEKNLKKMVNMIIIHNIHMEKNLLI